MEQDGPPQLVAFDPARAGARVPVVAGALIAALALAVLLNAVATRSVGAVILSATVLALVIGIALGKLRHRLGRRF